MAAAMFPDSRKRRASAWRASWSSRSSLTIFSKMAMASDVFPVPASRRRDGGVDILGVSDEALLGIEIAELEGIVGGFGRELVDLLADGQGLGEEAPPLVLLRDPLERPDGPVVLAGADIEVADDVESAHVLGVAEGELFVFGDGFPDPAAADVLLGLFDDPDPIAARAHGVCPQPSLNDVRCKPVGPLSFSARRCSSVP